MKLDLDKTIRMKLAPKREVCYVGFIPSATSEGEDLYVMAVKDENDYWTTYAISEEEVDAYYENVPPPPRYAELSLVWPAADPMPYVYWNPKCARAHADQLGLDVIKIAVERPA